MARGGADGSGRVVRMIVAFSISPSGGDDTGGVSAAVAEAVRVVRESGLPHETNAMFTNIEGEWDEVMAVVKRAVDVVAEVSPRVGLVLKADIRPGYDGQLTAKVERIEQALVTRCHVLWCRPAEKALHHAVERAADSAPADERADADRRNLSGFDRRTDLRHREDRVDRDEGIAGSEHDRLGAGDLLAHQRDQALQVLGVVRQGIKAFQHAKTIPGLSLQRNDKPL